MTDSRTNGFATPNSTVLGQLLPATGTRVERRLHDYPGLAAAPGDLGALAVALVRPIGLRIPAPLVLGASALEPDPLVSAPPDGLVAAPPGASAQASAGPPPSWPWRAPCPPAWRRWPFPTTRRAGPWPGGRGPWAWPR